MLEEIESREIRNSSYRSPGCSASSRSRTNAARHRSGPIGTAPMSEWPVEVAAVTDIGMDSGSRKPRRKANPPSRSGCRIILRRSGSRRSSSPPVRCTSSTASSVPGGSISVGRSSRAGTGVHRRVSACARTAAGDAGRQRRRTQATTWTGCFWAIPQDVDVHEVVARQRPTSSVIASNSGS